MSNLLNSHDLPMGQVRTGNDTEADGQLQTMLGAEAWVENVNWGASNPITKIDRRHFRIRLTRNVVGSAIVPRRQVDYGTTASNWGINVDGYTGDNETGNGIVDPFLPTAGAADDEIFNLVVAGPVDVENTADGAIAVGDFIVSAASGQVNEQTAAPANETAVMQQVKSFVGRAEEAAAASAER